MCVSDASQFWCQCCASVIKCMACTLLLRTCKALKRGMASIMRSYPLLSTAIPSSMYINNLHSASALRPVLRRSQLQQSAQAAIPQGLLSYYILYKGVPCQYATRIVQTFCWRLPYHTTPCLCLAAFTAGLCKGSVRLLSLAW